MDIRKLVFMVMMFSILGIVLYYASKELNFEHAVIALLVVIAITLNLITAQLAGLTRES